MKPSTCDHLLDTIADQLQSQFAVSLVDHQCVVVTPLLYPDNTRISISIEEHGKHRLLLTDNGEASDYAFVNGIGEPGIRDRVRKTVNRFGLVETKTGELMVDVPYSELTDGIFRLGTAIQDVAYMVYRRSSIRSQRRFKETVESFLTLSGRSFTKDVSIPGRTGNKKFDYHVSGNEAQQLLLSIFEATTSKKAIERVKVLAFDYGDIRSLGDESRIPPLVVLVDNTNQRVADAYSEEVEAILGAHVSRVITWTHRDEIDEMLVAA